ncbi:hypothetical protein BKA62DRAFT_154505 [Auriculariales sp. MPI-PUGE-AT-0066]|nr:hypothetical protein BKA62DRAFT_154505 [Auriculariales sp. MPI-PUGE-AT-0066]
MIILGFSLPFDLVCQLATAVHGVWGDHGLTRLCLVSRDFRDAGVPILYRALLLDTDALMLHFANFMAGSAKSLKHTRALSPWRDLDEAALDRAARIIDSCPNVSNLQTRLDVLLRRCRRRPKHLKTLFTWIDDASWTMLLDNPTLVDWHHLRRLHIEWPELRLAEHGTVSRDNLERVFSPANLPRLTHASIRWSFDYDFATQFRGSVRRFARLSDIILQLPTLERMLWRVPAKYAHRALAVPEANDPRVHLDLQDVKFARATNAGPATSNKGLWWDDSMGKKSMWTVGVPALDFIEHFSDSPTSDSS